MNRVPRRDSPALPLGKVLHLIFEDHFGGVSMAKAVESRLQEYIASAAGDVDTRVVTGITDIAEALPLWEDTFPVDHVLEVEATFELQDVEMNDLIWIGRPDRVVLSGGRIWHVQNRGLAANTNFGTYINLAKRHYHEHLYAEALALKYPVGTILAKAKRGRSRLVVGGYGGTIFNLVRKLKYRTYVGTSREVVKSKEEMFWQGPLSINLKGPLHESVMMSLRQHASEMLRVTREWNYHNIIPAPNEKMNGGFSGSNEDLYFKVLIGEIKLADDTFFKDREDTYAVANLGE